jgi:hypothetical protein
MKNSWENQYDFGYYEDQLWNADVGDSIRNKFASQS